MSPWDAAIIAAKAIAYAATLGSAGAIFFLAYCREFILVSDRRILGRLIACLAVVAVAASAAGIGVMGGSMGGDGAGIGSGALFQMIWNGGQGRAIEIRAAGLAFAFLSLLIGERSRAVPGAVATLAGVIAAAAAAMSFAWLGHARALPNQPWSLLLIALHLLAAAFWFGALPGLLIVSRRTIALELAPIVERFSAIAMILVAILIAAGMGLLCLLLTGVSDLWTSAYGRLVSLKLLIVAGLLGCAAYNKWRLTPLLRCQRPDAVPRLRTSIRLEIILGMTILTITALFTTLTGPPALE